MKGEKSQITKLGCEIANDMEVSKWIIAQKLGFTVIQCERYCDEFWHVKLEAGVKPMIITNMTTESGAK